MHHPQSSLANLHLHTAIPSVRKMLVLAKMCTTVFPFLWSGCVHACMQAQHQQHTRVFVFNPPQTGSYSYGSSQVSSNTGPDLSTERDPIPASADSCHQVK